MAIFIKIVNNTPTGDLLSEHAVRQLFPNTSFPLEPEEFAISIVEFGYAPVVEASVPTIQNGEKWDWGPIQLVGNQWTRTTVVSTLSGEELAANILSRKAKILRDVSAKRDQILGSGFSYDFGSPHGVQVLQTRGEPYPDRINWLTSQASYAAAVASGLGAEQGAVFRTESDVTITVSYAEGLNVLLAMAAWGKAVWNRSWELKDAINACADHAALDGININAGWPS